MSPTSYQTAPPRDMVGSAKRGGLSWPRPLASRPRDNGAGGQRISLPGTTVEYHPIDLRPLILVTLLFALAGRAGGALPGFRVEKVAGVPGFASSVVVDSQGKIYY